ncbi:MAG: hypothetical protein ABSB41_17365 [Anaerolineales bacterium]|jgi:hypothetical protein
MIHIRRSILAVFSVVLVLALAAAAVFLIRGRPAGGVAHAQMLSAPVPPDAQAAVQGVSTFYTIDFHETADQWASRLCKVLDSDTDCQASRVYLAPGVYSTAQKYSIQTSCSALPIRLVSDKVQDGREYRVWEMQATVSKVWPGMPSPAILYAEVVLDPASQKWAMTHVLLNDEVQTLQTAAP